MADHYQRATERLTKVELIKADLSRQFKIPSDQRDQREIGRLASKLRGVTAEAQVHALLAIAQRIDDIGRPA